MKARHQTQSMLRWWKEVGVDRADMAIKRRSGTMIWHHDLSIDALPIDWARARNVRQGEIYLRPSRGYTWPLVFLDDVSQSKAMQVCRKYDALAVETSRSGGCHVWLTCTRSLHEQERHEAQKWLAEQIEADPGSTSGEHLGRLAGFKNWKRGGVWVNVLSSSRRGRSWCPSVLAIAQNCEKDKVKKPNAASSDQDNPNQRSSGCDTSESGAEWGWVCGMLEAGFDQSTVMEKLVERARARRGKDVDRYVRKTLNKAVDRISASFRANGGF
jgi:hypothetical protein